MKALSLLMVALAIQCVALGPESAQAAPTPTPVPAPRRRAAPRRPC